MKTEIGVLLAMSGGVMVGNCMVPLKYLRRWRWENVWIIFSLVALVLLPWFLAFLKVPNLLGVYANVNGSNFIMPFAYGAGWGIAQVLFGLAVIRVGMALAFAVTIGLSAALGTLVPILFKDPAVLATARGSLFWLGLFLMSAGVVACSWAGRERETEQGGQAAHSSKRRYKSGILMATAAGLFAPMLNYALAFGDTFILEAMRQNTSPANAPYAVWPVALAGGAVPNIAYAGFLVYSNRSWANFSPLWPDIALGAIMGVLWMGSVAVYGTATTFLGALGASIGWSIYQICIILTANISGWITGEWRNVSLRSRVSLWSGLFLLGLATLALAFGGQ